MSEQNDENAMIPATQASPFESIRHTDEKGDYWTARELMPLLEYSSWQKFEEAIQRAMTDCAKSGREVADNFNLEVKNADKGSPGQDAQGVFNLEVKNAANAGGRPKKDYRLTRYACRLITMTSQTSGAAAAQARTYFSDRVDEAEQAEQFFDPDLAFMEWRRRAIESFMARGYSREWAERRVEDITARNALTHEWHVRGITDKEIPILTDRLHMRSFGLHIADHKEYKEFEVTYRGKKPIFKGDLPPAMTATELALNALSSTISRELHVTNDSHGYKEIASDVDVAGRIVGETRRQIEEATGRPVVSPRNMVKQPDGGLWGIVAPQEDGEAAE